MRTRALLSIRAALLIVICGSQHAYAGQEMLASAKSLYESASYEAALSELSAIDNTELVDVVDTYRALCLLGLGRVGDAEQTLRLIVTRKPLLVLSDADYSPRIVALFHDVRRKTLPAAAQRLYSTARADYENKKYAAASDGFRQALQVIEAVDPAAQTPALADMKELASGFLTLAEAKVIPEPSRPAPAGSVRAAAPTAPAPTAPAAAPPTALVAASTPPPAAPAAEAQLRRVQDMAPVVTENLPPFYTLSDTDVTPPVVIDQQLPPWSFAKNLPERAFTGTLELVIDDKGAVESVTLLDPVWPPYDAELLNVATKWRYQPARKAGKPVRFKRVLVIKVDPRARPR
jgi:hypothetical protein